MTSPVVAGTAESSTPTAGTSHVLNWTGLGTVAAGDLLLIVLDKGSTAASVNAHADWTELLDENLANGLYIAYRWATGGETAPTLVTSANTRSAEITYRITGAENPATTAPQIGTTATGTSATPDPPASATPPSSKDYLFIAFYGAAGEEADDDTWSDTSPTNYTPSPPRMKACGVAGTNLGGMIAAAERALTTAAAEDPGTFAKDVSAAWRAQTITVHPASSTTLTIAATAVGVATLTSASVIGKTLTATAVGVATLSTALLTSVTIAATAVGVATLSRIVTFSRSLAATAVGAATLTKGMFVTLTAMAIGVPSMAKGMFKTLAATATALPTLTPALLATVSIAATAVGVASLSKARMFVQTLSAVATGVASLATQFIQGTVEYSRRCLIWLGNHVGL